MKETVENFIKRCPEVSKSQLDQMHKKYFTDYIFYKKDRNKITGYCTHCKKSFDVPRYEEYPFLNEDFLAKCNHNSYVTCPCCKNQLLAKSMGIGKQSLYQETFKAIFFRKSDEKIYIRIGVAYMDFENIHLDHFDGVKFKTHYIYCLSPGCIKYAINYVWSSWQLCNSNKPVEPYSGENISYGFLNPDELSKCFLKYGLPYRCGGDWQKSYDGYKPIKYLQYLTLYPSVEMLCKLGLSTIVEDIVDNNNQCKRVVDLTGKSPTEVFKCTKQEFNQIREYAATKSGISPEYLKCYKALKKIKPNIKVSEAFEFYDNGDWRIRAKLMKLTYLSWPQINDYLKKQLFLNKEQITYNSSRRIRLLYSDYISECITLKLNLKDTVVSKPKDLYEAHSKTSKLINYKKIEIEKEILKKRNKTLTEKYSFSNKDFFIKIPESLQEIIDEGSLLSHCVDRYAEDHAKGRTTILFLRKVGQPHKPYFTIEVHNDKVDQIRGYKNKALDNEKAKEFFEEWKLHIIKTHKKSKQKPKAKKEVAA